MNLSGIFRQKTKKILKNIKKHIKTLKKLIFRLEYSDKKSFYVKKQDKINSITLDKQLTQNIHLCKD